MSFRAGLAWSWTLVVLVICWFPRFAIPRVEEEGYHLFGIPHLDKLIHFGIFAVLAFLWLRVAPSLSRASRVFLAGLALAVVTELVQELPIIHRDAGWLDGAADAVGLAAGLLPLPWLGRPVVVEPAS